MLHSNKPLSLALQGGGAHGAFTWGVLDRLLESGQIDVEGISATSSGAMNAVVMAQGMTAGGAERAREELAGFWETVAERSPFELPAPGVFGLMGGGSEPPTWMQAYVGLSRTLSPYVMNPLDINPLRDILRERLDFDRLRAACSVKLFIAATRVSNGRIRIFRNDELSVEALLASACVPSVHHAVQIDGESYWDGGFAGNPALFPLIYECRSEDIVIVMLHPLQRDRTPTSAKAIWEHMSEIAFNTAFMREMQSIAQLKHQAEQLWGFGPVERRIKRLKLHLIEGEDSLSELSHLSRFNARWSFLKHLRDRGRDHASQWMEEEFPQVGSRSTLDLQTHFA